MKAWLSWLLAFLAPLAPRRVTLADYATWRRAEARKLPTRDAQHEALVLEELTAAALTARRAGVVPTLELLATSGEVEAAWLRAAALFAEEEPLRARGLTPQSALERSHDVNHAQVARELAELRKGP